MAASPLVAASVAAPGGGDAAAAAAAATSRSPGPGAAPRGGGGGTVLLGVAVAFVGTLMAALGTHLVAKSHRIGSKAVAWRAYAAGNALLVVVGTAFHLWALALAPQSLISPLGSLNIVNTVVLARLPFFGGVALRPREALATAVTLMGCVVVVLAGPGGESPPPPPSQTQPQPFQSGRPASLLQAVFGPSFFVFFLTSVGLVFALESYAERSDANAVLARAAASASGGVLGGLTNVFAKAAVDSLGALSLSSSDAEGLGKPPPTTSSGMARLTLVPLLAVAMLASSLGTLQIVSLNRSLARFSALGVIPIYQVSLLLSASLSGGVAFGELYGLGFLRLVAFFLGMVLSCLGVSVLASSPQMQLAGPSSSSSSASDGASAAAVSASTAAASAAASTTLTTAAHALTGGALHKPVLTSAGRSSMA